MVFGASPGHQCLIPPYPGKAPVLPRLAIKLDMDKPSTASAASPRRADPGPIHSQAPPAVSATERHRKALHRVRHRLGTPVSATQIITRMSMRWPEVRVIGFGVADISRPDLERAPAEEQLNAYAFVVSSLTVL